MTLRVRMLGLLYAVLCLAAPRSGAAHESADTAGRWSSARPDGHAPIGVMGDHLHTQGEWMVSYRYRHMVMKGHLSDDDRVSTEDVLTEFMVSPIKMRTEMQMTGVMYALTDDVTLMGMAPILKKKMDHRNRMGARFTTAAEGLGDVRATALIGVYDDHQQRVHLNVGLGIPTGSIDESDDTPLGHIKLPYPMQLGSGTWDLLPGITYLGERENWSWGAQALGVVRLGTNSNDYRLGHRADLTTWTAYRWSEWISTSVRFGSHFWGDLNGADPGISLVAPTGDPRRRGGTRLEYGLGINLYAPRGPLTGHRAAIELALPLYQDLEGPQLGQDWSPPLGGSMSSSVAPPATGTGNDSHHALRSTRHPSHAVS